MKHRSVHAVNLSYCPCGLQSAGVGTQVLVSHIIITPLQTDANRRTNWWEGNLTFDPFLLEASPVFSPCLTLPEVNKLYYSASGVTEVRQPTVCLQQQLA